MPLTDYDRRFLVSAKITPEPLPEPRANVFEQAAAAARYAHDPLVTISRNRYLELCEDRDRKRARADRWLRLFWLLSVAVFAGALAVGTGRGW
jgi:hypothetical protein